MPSKQEIQAWLINQIAEELEVSPSTIDPNQPFDSIGLDSQTAVGISGDLEQWLDRTLAPTLLWEYPSVAQLSAYLAGEVTEPVAAETSESAGGQDDPVVIVGMGCRLPGADNLKQFWDNLLGGVDAISEVPADRWDINAYYDPEAGERGRMYTRFGGFMNQIDEFDPGFFGITKTEADRMDPQQRILMEVVWEALEDAGIQPDALAGTPTGVFLGMSTSDYSELQMSDPRYVDAYAGTGNAFSIAANRLSYFLDLRGPSMTTDTACSSSLVALHQACASLESGESTLAMAGGVNVLLRPEITVTFSQARMMAPDGRCKTFDAAADGYVRGEGCGMVVLKKMSQAVADGDRIYAMVRATAINHDGRTNGLTAPNGLSQQAVIRTALSRAGLEGKDIEYIEAHGTGTALGDPIEVDSLRETYGKARTPNEPLVIGSAKTNVGHLEPAAGVTGLIKSALQLYHNQIVPHLHFNELNPKIDFGGVPFQVPTEARDWPQANAVHRSAISSFGFGGTNSHAILESPPAREVPAQTDDGKLKVYAVSAASKEALDAQLEQHAAFVADSNNSLTALCYSTLATRRAFNHRAAVAARDVDDLRAALADKKRIAKGVATTAPVEQFAFLFTGQGAQYVGMGKELYDAEPVFKDCVDRCAKILDGELDRPLLDVMFGEDKKDKTINETGFTQPALFVIEYATAELLRHYGFTPSALIGHSIGEIAAACFGGALSLEDALKLVAQRGRLMQALPEGGGMLAALTSADKLEPFVAPHAEQVSIAAKNAPESTVIAGDLEALDAIKAKLQEEGIAAKPLPVSHAFHSPLMDPMLDEFRAVVEQLNFQPLQIPIASNVTGEMLEAGHTYSVDYWCDHVMGAVRFLDGIAALDAAGPYAYIEVGPAPTLVNLAKRCLDSDPILVPCLSPKEPADNAFGKALAKLWADGAPVDYAAQYAGLGGYKADLPTYPFQRTRCWFDPPQGLPEWTPANLGPGRSENPADWVYELAWEKAPEAAAAKWEAEHGWLLLADDSGLIEDIAKRLADREETLYLVKPGSDYQSPGDGGHWVIDPADESHYHKLFEEFRGLGMHLPETIVHAWLYGTESSESDPLAGTRDSGCVSLCCLAHAIEQAYSGTEEHRSADTRVWIVTQGAQSVAGETVAPHQAAVWGFGRVLFAEDLALKGGLVDLDPDKHDDNAEALLQSMDSASHEDQVCYRDGACYVARIKRTDAKPDLDAPVALQSDAAYLITGGLGGLGLATASTLAAQGAKHIVLLSRTPMPPREEWPGLEADSPMAARAQGISDLEDQGVSVYTAAFDIADADALNKFLREWQDAGRPQIRGVVHAAGATDVKLIQQLDAEAIDIEFGPKVFGAWNLHRAFSELDFMVLFSSVASVLGLAGQAKYAAANAYLDGLALQRRAAGQPAVSLNWGPWAQVGMASGERFTKRMESQGFHSMTPDDATRLFAAMLNHESPQSLVLDVDWEQLAKHTTLSGRRHLLANLAQGYARAAADEGPRVTQGGGDAPELDRIVAVLCRLVAEAIQQPEDTLSAESDMFELGLDSLRVIELIHNIELELHLKLYPKEFLDRPIIGDLAGYIAAELAGETPAPAAGGDPGVGTGGKLTVTTRRDLRPMPKVESKNPPMVFVLSGPRCGSTLFRVMMAGHPDLFVPPELHLLQFDTMKERHEGLGTSYLAEGLPRAIMELEGVDADQAQAIVDEYVERDASTQEVYLRIQKACAPRLLVDKSPSYASAMDTLLRGEVYFDGALYIHLSRHPYAMIESFVRNRFDRLVYEGADDAIAQGEHVWSTTNCNAIDFREEIDKERGFWVRYEDVVGTPEKTMRKVCKFLKRDYAPMMIHPYEGDRMTDGVHKQSFSIGDPNFLQHSSIDPTLGQTWRNIKLGRKLTGFSTRLAKELDYELPHEHVRGPLRIEKFQTMVPIQPEGDGPPLYIFAPASGLVFLYHSLDKHVSKDRPLFAMQDPALQEGHPPFKTMGQLADKHVKTITKHQPEGPYYLSGWSFGGMLAYEVAKRLKEQGKEVAGLIIIDTDSRTKESERGIGARLTQLWASIRGLTDVGDYVRDGIIIFSHGLKQRSAEGGSMSLSEKVQWIWTETLRRSILRDAEMNEMLGADSTESRMAMARVPLLQTAMKNLRGNMQALRAYKAEPMHGKILLLRGEQSLEFHPNHELPDLGWSKLALDGVKVNMIPGNHMSLFSDRFVEGTAHAMNDAMDELIANWESEHPPAAEAGGNGQAEESDASAESIESPSK